MHVTPTAKRGYENTKTSKHKSCCRTKKTGRIAHCIAEAWYDDAWHAFDPDQRSFHLRADNRTVASLEELRANPELMKRTWSHGFASPTGKDKYIHAFIDTDPPVVMPAENNWTSRMEMRVRPGEKFIWRWDDVGKYRCGDNDRNIRPETPRGSRPHGLANGKMVFRPRLSPLRLQQDAVLVDNLHTVENPNGKKHLQAQTTSRPGTLIYKVHSPYPIVGGIVGGRFVCGDRDTCRVSLSVHDQDWIEVFEAESGRAAERYVPLDELLNPIPTPPIYEYYVKFELDGKAAKIEAFYLESEVQMSRLALPALSLGVNRVVYRDESDSEARVRIRHGWKESSVERPPLPPASPVQPADGGRIDLKSPKLLKWQVAVDPDDQPIADYHIQVSPRPDMLHPVSPNFDRIIFSDAPRWSVPEGWLVGGRTYYWRVRARDAWSAWSDWSPVWSFTVGK